MAKKGMSRPERTHTKSRNRMDPVPEIQGKARHGERRARPIVSGTSGSAQKVYHTDPPVPEEDYPVIDTDLARDNLENDLPAADRQDL